MDPIIASFAGKEDLIVRYFFVPSTVSQTSTITQSSKNPADPTKISIMRGLLRDDDDVSKEDEICLVFRATAAYGVDVHPLQWWSVNLKRFPLMAKLAPSMLLAQFRSVPSEVMNAPAGNLIGSNRTSLEDFAIDASIRAQS